MKPFAILLLAGLLLAGCSQPAFTPTSIPSLPAGTLVRYFTATATPTRQAETPIPVSPSPTLSPTPFIHTVGAGEVFSAIAARYGLTVEELRAANPDVILSPFLAGQKLVIPGQNSFTPTPPPPTPTPLPVEIGQPSCLADAAGGAWCFLLAHNPLGTDLENLSAALEISDANGNVLRSTASGLLNLLPAGASLPLMVYVAQVQPPLLVKVIEWDALPVSAEDTRYLPARLEDLNVQISSDGLSASAQGQIVLEGETPASLVWAALTAFDADGKMIGARRWESPAGIEPGGSGLLDGRVYSAGGKIVRVEVLLEVRP